MTGRLCGRSVCLRLVAARARAAAASPLTLPQSVGSAIQLRSSADTPPVSVRRRASSHRSLARGEQRRASAGGRRGAPIRGRRCCQVRTAHRKPALVRRWAACRFHLASLRRRRITTETALEPFRPDPHIAFRSAACARTASRAGAARHSRRGAGAATSRAGAARHSRRHRGYVVAERARAASGAPAVTSGSCVYVRRPARRGLSFARVACTIFARPRSGRGRLPLGVTPGASRRAL